MGLAASQGRYLCLTARNSDLVYEGQQISQQRLALTKETQQVADKYNEAMSNTIMQATTVEGGTQQLTYDVITSQDPFSGLCMRLVDLNGSVVMPEDYLEVTATNPDGKSYTKNYSSTEDFIKKFYPDASGDELASLQMMSLEAIGKHYTENNPDSGVSVSFKDKHNSSIVKEGEAVLKDINCLDPKYIQEMITTGQWFLQQASADPDEPWEDVMWQGSTAISEVYDTSDDAAAEAEYESAMTEIQKRDKLLELRLEQVQTEQSAVAKEMDSIKSVIDKNIESSFTTFS